MSGSRLSKRLFQALEWPQDNVKSASEMTEYIKKFKSAQHLWSAATGAANASTAMEQGSSD